MQLENGTVASIAADRKSIVQTILDEVRNKAVNKKVELPEGIEPTQLTVETFFSHEFANAQEFIDHIRSLDENEHAAFDALLELMRDGFAIDSPNFEKRYNGRRRMYIVNEQPRGNREFPVFTTGNMKSFIGLYQMGLLECNFNLEDLCREAVRLTAPQQ